MCECECCCQYDEDEDEYDYEYREDFSREEDCRCGAYVWKNGTWIQVADCVC